MARSGARIGIDLTALLPRRTGVDVCLQNLIVQLAAINDERFRFVLFVNRGDENAFGRLDARFEVVPSSTRWRAHRLFFQQLVLPGALARRGIAVLHSPSFFMPLRRGPSRHVLTVYDTTSFSRPEDHNWLRGSAAFRALMTASVRRADTVVVPSQFVAREVLRLMPFVAREAIRVIPLGVSEEFQPRSGDRAEGSTPYVLFVGTMEPRKGLPLLICAFRTLAREGRTERLVIAGQDGWGGEDLRGLAAPLGDLVEFRGYVQRSDLPELYAGAVGFVYPSSEEGFGLPPLEAMACGVPVIASNNSALAENLEGAAELFATGSELALLEALRRVLTEAGRRARLREAGLTRAARFRWSHFASATLASYAELVSRDEG